MSGTLAKRVGDIQVRLEPLEETVLAEVQQRRIAVEQHDRVVRVGDVDLRDARTERPTLLDRVDHARGQRRPAPASTLGVDDSCRGDVRDSRDGCFGTSPSTIGRSNSLYSRAELVDHRAVTVDEVQLVPLTRQPDRPALGNEDVDGRRQHAPQRDVGDPR